MRVYVDEMFNREFRLVSRWNGRKKIHTRVHRVVLVMVVGEEVETLCNSDYRRMPDLYIKMLGTKDLTDHVKPHTHI